VVVGRCRYIHITHILELHFPKRRVRNLDLFPLFIELPRR
jgi:hypothetical protein